MTADGWRGQDGQPGDGTREGDYLGDGNLPWPLPREAERESIPDQLDRAWGAMADAEPADLVQFLDVLANAKKACEDIRKQVEAKLLKVLGRGSHPVDDAIVRASESSPQYSEWNRDALLRDVLDSRRFNKTGAPMTAADGTTVAPGDVIPETPMDKILHVWNLGAPRRDALRERGLEPKDYAHVERKAQVSVLR